MLVGTAGAAVWAIRAPGRPCSRLLAQWIFLSYGLGVYAVVPSLLRKAGIPEAICHHPMMNVFLLHPAIDAWRPGGMLIGQLLLVGLFSSQYAALLVAIARIKRNTDHGRGSCVKVPTNGRGRPHASQQARPPCLSRYRTLDGRVTRAGGPPSAYKARQPIVGAVFFCTVHSIPLEL